MRPRLSLNDLLLTYCPNVYYQPPDSIKMRYPCIVYNRRNDSVRHADGVKYTRYDSGLSTPDTIHMILLSLTKTLNRQLPRHCLI